MSGRPAAWNRAPQKGVKSMAMRMFTITHRENRVWKLMTAPAMVFLILLSVYPMVFNVYNSFFDWNLARPDSGRFVGLANYIDAFTNANLGTAFFNTLVFMFWAVAVEFTLGFALALLLSTYKGPSKIIRSLMITPTMIAPIVASLMWLFMFNADYGVIKWLLQLCGVENPPAILASRTWAMPAVIAVDVWQWTPFVMLTIFAGITALPKDLIEASCVDGANSLQRLIHVIVPSLKPVIAVVLLMRVMDSFKSFEVIYMLTKGGPGNATETVSYYAYKVGFSFFEIGQCSAICLLIGFVVTAICSALNRLISDEWSV